MKLTKETKDSIKEYCLNAITSEDTTFKNDEDKVKYAYNRFISEFDHEIKRNGKFKAFNFWLQGLALDIDFYNYRILELSKEWGQNPKTETQEDKLIIGWWDFMTNQYFKLFKYYKLEV